MNGISSKQFTNEMSNTRMQEKQEGKGNVNW